MISGGHQHQHQRQHQHNSNIYSYYQPSTFGVASMEATSSLSEVVNSELSSIPPCEFCGKSIRKATKEVCSRCYSGLYNDIRKWIKAVPSRLTMKPEDVTPKQFIEDMRKLPRGCVNNYKCMLPLICNRCRTIRIVSRKPDVLFSMLNKGLIRFVSKTELCASRNYPYQDNNDDDDEDNNE
eukprot:m.26618 g.26618  ORF g.26618 m.26618 type:complete len:181 (-) comp5870_c1_seq1:265-807(-)